MHSTVVHNNLMVVANFTMQATVKLLNTLIKDTVWFNSLLSCSFDQIQKVIRTANYITLKFYNNKVCTYIAIVYYFNCHLLDCSDILFHRSSTSKNSAGV